MDLIASLFLVVLVDTDDTRRTTDARQRVWHRPNLPTGELKMLILLHLCHDLET